MFSFTVRNTAWFSASRCALILQLSVVRRQVMASGILASLVDLLNVATAPDHSQDTHRFVGTKHPVGGFLRTVRSTALRRLDRPPRAERCQRTACWTAVRTCSYLARRSPSRRRPRWMSTSSCWLEL